MSSNRYQDNYGRDSRSVRRTDSRDVRDTRETRDTRDTREVRDPRDRDSRDTRDPRQDRMVMEVERPVRLVQPERAVDRAVDMRDVRAVPTARVESRTTRAVPPPRDDEMMYEARPAAYSRETRRYESDFADPTPNVQPIFDSRRPRDEPRTAPRYHEYFLPGDGIDREVLASEICNYLDSDATCRPATNSDGRRGFIYRAYRALTSEMVRSIQDESARYARRKEDAARRKTVAVPYAQAREQRYEEHDVMMDDDDDDDRSGPRYTIRHQEPDPRNELRNEPRLGRAVPTGGTYIDPGYPQYAHQQPQPGTLQDPRYVSAGIQQGFPAGNTTPPTVTSRTPTGGYAQPGYPPGTTRAPSQPMTAPPAFPDYRDPRANPPPQDPNRRYR